MFSDNAIKEIREQAIIYRRENLTGFQESVNVAAVELSMENQLGPKW